MSTSGTVAELLARSAARFPEREAVVAGERRVSYRELASMTDRLAAGLRMRGAHPGERVALLLPNCPEFVAAYFAVARIGAIVVPLNPLYKPDELQYILGDSGAAGVLTVPPLAPLVAAAGGRAWPLADLLATPPDPQPPVDVRPEDVCACLYTSGTTGRPKGALLTHGNLTFDAEACLTVLEVDERDRFLTVIPLFHSFGAMACMLVPVRLGAAAVHLERFRPEAVLDAIRREHITIWPGVPGFYATILATVRHPEAHDLSSLRLAVTGGAPMPAELMRRFEAAFGCIVLEGNGPTETSPVSYVNPAHGERKPGSVGLPLPGVEVRVVSETDQAVPAGTIGEICVRGPNVMRGYWRRPEETATALRGGWFHTGDLGYRDADGYVFIVDRKQDLILVGGLNVYPSEIEGVLSRHPAVAEAAVVGRPHPLRGEQVVAIVVLRAGAGATSSELSSWCRDRLAAYKCPRRIEFLSELPRSASGKVAKGALRAAP